MPAGVLETSSKAVGAATLQKKIGSGQRDHGDIRLG